MSQTTTPTAGLDIGKLTLDLALTGRAEVMRLDNTPEGHAALIATLRAPAVDLCQHGSGARHGLDGGEDEHQGSIGPSTGKPLVGGFF